MKVKRPLNRVMSKQICDLCLCWIFITVINIILMNNKKDYIKNVGDFKLIKEIGHGSFGKVYKGVDEKGNLFAIKMVGRENISSKLEEMLQVESTVLNSINHPNIIKLHHLRKTAANYYFIFEYCDQGDLEMYRISNHGHLDEISIQYFAQQISLALSELHKKGIMHRDLKLANVLLAKSDTELPISKLGDFGFAYPVLKQEDLSMTECNITGTFIGTPLNMSPEIQNKMAYNYQTDIWSFGCMMFILFTGSFPFMAITKDDLKVIVNNGIYRMKADPQPSAYFVDFIQRCLQHEVKSRIRISDILLHPFILATKEKLIASQKSKIVEQSIKNGYIELSTRNYAQFIDGSEIPKSSGAEEQNFMGFEILNKEDPLKILCEFEEANSPETSVILNSNLIIEPNYLKD